MKNKIIIALLTIAFLPITFYFHYLSGGLANVVNCFALYSIILVINYIVFVLNNIKNKRELKDFAKFHKNLFEINHNLPITK